MVFRKSGLFNKVQSVQIFLDFDFGKTPQYHKTINIKIICQFITEIGYPSKSSIELSWNDLHYQKSTKCGTKTPYSKEDPFSIRSHCDKIRPLLKASQRRHNPQKILSRSQKSVLIRSTFFVSLSTNL